MSKLRKPTKPAARPRKRPQFRRRGYGKLSVLDKLAEPVKAELRARWENTQLSYPQLVSWLAAEHQLSTSQTALSEWFKRQREVGLLAAPGQAPLGSVPFEVLVNAPGAQSITVTIRPLPSAPITKPV